MTPARDWDVIKASSSSEKVYSRKVEADPVVQTKLTRLEEPVQTSSGADSLVKLRTSNGHDTRVQIDSDTDYIKSTEELLNNNVRRKESAEAGTNHMHINLAFVNEEVTDLDEFSNPRSPNQDRLAGSPRHGFFYSETDIPVVVGKQEVDIPGIDLTLRRSRSQESLNEPRQDALTPLDKKHDYINLAYDGSRHELSSTEDSRQRDFLNLAYDKDEPYVIDPNSFYADNSLKRSFVSQYSIQLRGSPSTEAMAPESDESEDSVKLPDGWNKIPRRRSYNMAMDIKEPEVSMVASVVSVLDHPKKEKIYDTPRISIAVNENVSSVDNDKVAEDSEFARNGLVEGDRFERDILVADGIIALELPPDNQGDDRGLNEDYSADRNYRQDGEDGPDRGYLGVEGGISLDDIANANERIQHLQEDDRESLKEDDTSDRCDKDGADRTLGADGRIALDFTANNNNSLQHLQADLEPAPDDDDKADQGCLIAGGRLVLEFTPDDNDGRDCLQEDGAEQERLQDSGDGADRECLKVDGSIVVELKADENDIRERLREEDVDDRTRTTDSNNAVDQECLEADGRILLELKANENDVCESLEADGGTDGGRETDVDDAADGERMAAEGRNVLGFTANDNYCLLRLQRSGNIEQESTTNKETDKESMTDSDSSDDSNEDEKDKENTEKSPSFYDLQTGNSDKIHRDNSTDSFKVDLNVNLDVSDGHHNDSNIEGSGELVSHDHQQSGSPPEQENVENEIVQSGADATVQLNVDGSGIGAGINVFVGDELFSKGNDKRLRDTTKSYAREIASINMDTQSVDKQSDDGKIVMYF